MAWSWKPYVRVAQRRAQAVRYAAKLAKQGKKLIPVQVAGRTIAATFWGKAWCDNLESYSDYANRLPRGRTYLRNGSVIDLQIERGRVTAQVSGSSIYQVEIKIRELPGSAWRVIQRDCAASIHSLLDLLQGRFSKAIMERLTRPRDGLFPQPTEISLRCSCPDSAVLCKHVAAALYGVGARLDREPELLFLLRAVDHAELVQQALSDDSLKKALDSGEEADLGGQDLGELFGIELDVAGSEKPAKGGTANGRNRRSTRDGKEQKKSKASQAAGTTAKAVKRAVVKGTAQVTRAGRAVTRAGKAAASKTRKPRTAADQ